MRRYARYLITIPLLTACQSEPGPTSPGRRSAHEIVGAPATTVVGSSWQATITDYARYWPATRGIGINDAGDITAQITPPLGPRFNHAALVAAHSRQFIDIGTLGGPSSLPSAIGSTQGIVGSADRLDNTGRAFLWHQATGMRDLGTLGGGSSVAYDINASDDIVGSAET